MSLQTQYRPNSFKLFAGNESIKRSISEMLKRDKPPSAFMIIGPSGCGKTTLGRIIARGLKCHKSDFNEMNSADDNSVKAIRKILADMKYSPLNGPKKVILFDEAHRLSAASQDALLKGLEEPPEHVHFIVCTNHPEVFKDVFKRRCHIYEVSLLTSAEIIVHLKKIMKAEKVNDFPQIVLDKIIELSNGSLGIALKNLDMVIDMGDDPDRALETLKSSGTSEAEVIDICRALINFNMTDVQRWNRVKKLISEFQGDGESARRPILGYLSKCLLNSKMGKDTGNMEAIAIIMEAFERNFYDSGMAGLVLACFNACNINEGE